MPKPWEDTGPHGRHSAGGKCNPWATGPDSHGVTGSGKQVLIFSEMASFYLQQPGRRVFRKVCTWGTKAVSDPSFPLSIGLPTLRKGHGLAKSLPIIVLFL